MPARAPKALVLAAGLGSRIRSVSEAPKPLMRFGDRPILGHTLAWLARAGVTCAIINLHYKAEAVRAAIGDGSAYGLSVTYAFEPELLGAAGALANIQALADWPMLVVYGDSLVRFDLAALQRTHAEAGAEATVALFDQRLHRHTGIAGGHVQLGADGRVLGFTEGGAAAPDGPALVNAGVYMVEKGVLDLIAPGRLVDFGRDVFPAMLAQGRPLHGHVLEPSGFCLGLDTPESWAEGRRLLREGAVALA